MNTKKILLIDYDPVSIRKIVTPLAKAGFDVEVAKDGVSGLEAFERIEPSLVLVEAMLPRKHGFEVCQEIKAKPGAKKTPVLITTAVCRGRKYRMDALQIYGCDEYIEKPIADDKLVSMIGSFIDQAAHAREEVQQELSEAIDTAAAVVSARTADVPAAIESMSDAELEAQIDSMLLGNESSKTFEAISPAEDKAVVARQEPVEEPAVESDRKPERVAAPRGPVDSVNSEEHVAPILLDGPTETEALPIASTPEPLAKPAPISPNAEIDPAPPVVSEPIVESPAPHPTEAGPSVQTTQVSAVVPPVPAKKEGRSKALLLAVAAAATIGVVGFLALQQGWLGESAAPTETTADRTNPPPVRQPPASIDRFASDPGPGAGPMTQQDEPPIPNAMPQLEPTASAEVAVTETPRPVVPSKPAAFTGRSAAERKAARDKQRRAEEAMLAAAGSLEDTLLSTVAEEPPVAADEPVSAIEFDDTPIGTPVRPRAQRGELLEMDEVDRAPVPVRFEQPVYDELARRMRQEGEILVAVLIDEAGTVVEAKLTQEIPRSRLNDSALRAAKTWAYRPAIKDGVPVRVWKIERIVFDLE